MAGSDVQGRNIDGLLHDIQGDGDQKNQEPDRQGETDGNVCLLPGVSHGVHYHPVPLHAEAGHEEDGAVHIAIEKANQHLAKGIPIGPVVAMQVIGNLQGEPDDREEVGQGQIGHVNHSRVFFLGPEKEDPEGHAIAGQTNHKHNGVDDRKKDSSQLPSEDGCRELINRKAGFYCIPFPRVWRGGVQSADQAPSFTVGSWTEKAEQGQHWNKWSNNNAALLQ